MHINDIDLTRIEDFIHSVRTGAGEVEGLADVEAICQNLRSCTATDEQLDLARSEWAGKLEDISIDDDAGTSETNEGFWIAAWLWVPRQEEAENA